MTKENRHEKEKEECTGKKEEGRKGEEVKGFTMKTRERVDD